MVTGIRIIFSFFLMLLILTGMTLSSNIAFAQKSRQNRHLLVQYYHTYCVQPNTFAARRPNNTTPVCLPGGERVKYQERSSNPYFKRRSQNPYFSR